MRVYSITSYVVKRARLLSYQASYQVARASIELLAKRPRVYLITTYVAKRARYRRANRVGSF